jgi:hypothetical protein
MVFPGAEPAAKGRGMTTTYEIPDAPAPVERPGFKFHRAADMLGEVKPLPWLIRDILVERSLVFVLGPYECGKSFLALDWICCVATKAPWCGFEIVSPGLVAYVCGEGHAGIARRLRAWQIARQVDLAGAPIIVSATAAPLDDPLWAQAVSDSIAAQAEALGQPVRMVVVDTLSRNVAGDENSTADMARLVRSLDTHFRERFGAAVIVVHHTGLVSSSRGRGSTVLPGAADADFMVSRQDRSVTLTPGKTKDWDAAPAMVFELRTVELGIFDDIGRAQTSCVMHPAGPVSAFEGPSAAGLSERQRIALQALRTLYEQHRSRLAEGGVDSGQARVLLDDWRQALHAAGMTDRRRWSETVEALARRNLITKAHPYVLLA